MVKDYTTVFDEIAKNKETRGELSDEVEGNGNQRAENCNINILRLF